MYKRQEKEWYATYLEAIGPVFAPVYQDLAEDEVWSSGANQKAIEYVQNATGYYGYPAQTLEGRAIASKNYYSFPIARMLNSIVTGSKSLSLIHILCQRRTGGHNSAAPARHRACPDDFYNNCHS